MIKQSISIAFSCAALLIGQNVMAQEQVENQAADSEIQATNAENQAADSDNNSTIVSRSEMAQKKAEQAESQQVDSSQINASETESSDNVAVADEQQEVEEDDTGVANWTSIEHRKYYMPYTEPAGRVAGEVAGGILSILPTAGIGLMLSQIAVDGGLYKNADMTNRMDIIDRGCVIGAIIVPFMESAGIHLVGSLLGNVGESWTPYAGGVTGGAIGAGLGALGFLKSDSMGERLIFVGAAVGALIGAVTWYELSHNKELEKYYISSVYPVLEVSDQRTVMGIGMEF